MQFPWWSQLSAVHYDLTGGGGGKITPQADVFAAILEPAISEPHVVDIYPLLTFPKYVWAMRWHDPGLSIILQNSNMVTAKPEIVKFSKKSRNKALYLRQDINEIPTALPRIWVQLFNAIHRNTVQLNRKWKNPRWRPKNFDCVYLRFQTGQHTRYNRNSKS